MTGEHRPRTHLLLACIAVSVACSRYSVDAPNPTLDQDASAQTRQDGAAAGAGSGGAAGVGGPGGSAGSATSAGSGAAAGRGGVVAPAASSCTGLANSCGPNSDADCCASNLVAGGTFNRSDHVDFPATVSDFGLDVYEITVGRFRKFVEAGYGTQQKPPDEGSGVNPNVTASGWQSGWNVNLALDTSALKSALQCDPFNQIWTNYPSTHEHRPINCIDWFDAFAFCIWDGGRLPTETEWNYAAAGGIEQRAYPWSVPSTAELIDSTYAVYCSSAESCPMAKDVGSSSPKGDGRWGHADLAGNLWEWTLDWFADYQNPCNDCAHLAPASYRAYRGGGLFSRAEFLRTSYRYCNDASGRYNEVGARCARSASGR